MKRIFTLIFAFLMIASSTLFAEWEDCNDGLRYPRIKDFNVIDNNFYCSTRSGIYKANNNNLKWELFAYQFDNNYLFNINKIIKTQKHVFLINEFVDYTNKIIRSNDSLTKFELFDLQTSQSFITQPKDIFEFQDRVFIITDDNTFFTDNLIDFTVLDLPYPNKVTSIIELNNSLFIADQNNGIFVSKDKGTTWQSTNFGLNNLSINLLKVNKSNLFAVDINNLIYISTNGGLNWELRSNKFSENPQLHIVTMIIDSNKIYVLDKKGNLHFSKDLGINWEIINSNPTMKYFIASDLKISGNDLYLWNQYQGIYKSEDNGKSWNTLNNGLHGYFGRSFESNNKFLLTSNEADIFRSSNHGKNWEIINIDTNGIGGKIFSMKENYCIIESPDKEQLFISSDQGLNWKKLYYNVSLNSNYKFNENDLIISKGKDLLYSNDFGLSWHKREINSNLILRKVMYNKFFLAKDADHYVYISNDDASSWQRTNLKAINNYYLEKTTVNGDNFIIYEHDQYNKRTILVSKDKGINWEKVEINSNLDADKRYYFNESILYVLQVDYSKIETNYMHSIFYSYDFGKTWKEYKIFNEHKLSDIIIDFCVDSDYIYFASNFGVHRTKLSEIGISTEINDEPISSSNNSDYTVYPNPSTDYLNIHFTNNVNPNSKIELFDILGNQVYQSQITSSGQDTKINLESLQAGVYLLKIADKVERIVVNK